MVLTEEEKRKRHNTQQKQSRDNLTERAKHGDKKAQKQLNKERRSRAFSACKTYIRRHASKQDISEIRDVIAGRIKELNEKDKK